MFKIGIIGLGTMGKLMLESMVNHPQFIVVGGWDTSKEACEIASKMVPNLPITKTAEFLLQGYDIDCVYIATPPSTHAHYAELASNLGLSILCEKPLGVDLSSSQHLVSLVNDLNIPNAVNFTLMNSPLVSWLRSELIQNNGGEIQAIEIRHSFNEWPRKWQGGASEWLSRPQEGGFIREVFSHFVFMMQNIWGNLSIQSLDIVFGESELSETELFGVLLTESGIKVSIVAGTGRCAPELNEMTIYGTSASYRYVNWSEVFVTHGADWKPVLEKNLPPVNRQLDEIALWLESGSANLASFDDANQVQLFIEEMLEKLKVSHC
ncbi:Gfo/Idh/MocA family oxidoreductase [uncultured Shewanella sp.]|uniref:Gfo/Idh/MocA family protein n=1 Tax=uncultured Shewanella sp. TaxID=173975 RepID=UPI0026227FA7|nr:Gfo/Idh/MocA family oxidoreductase [uncultured Shewanella sp.]